MLDGRCAARLLSHCLEFPSDTYGQNKLIRDSDNIDSKRLIATPYLSAVEFSTRTTLTAWVIAMREVQNKANRNSQRPSIPRVLGPTVFSIPKMAGRNVPRSQLPLHRRRRRGKEYLFAAVLASVLSVVLLVASPRARSEEPLRSRSLRTPVGVSVSLGRSGGSTLRSRLKSPFKS